MTNFYEKLTSINSKLTEEGTIQDTVGYLDKEYRESIKREIELLSQKEELLNKQHRFTLDEMEIARIKGITDEKWVDSSVRGESRVHNGDKKEWVKVSEITSTKQPKTYEEAVVQSLHRIEELLKNNQTTTIHVNSVVDGEKAAKEVFKKVLDGIEKRIK